MISSILNPHARELCELAQQDESTLQYPLPDHIYGFHAQQSCEKLMKALITSHNRKYNFTHSLQKLSEAWLSCGEIMPVTPTNVLSLEPFAVQLRYTTGTPLTDAERIQIKRTVEIFAEHVISRILQLQSTP